MSVGLRRLLYISTDHGLVELFLGSSWIIADIFRGDHKLKFGAILSSLSSRFLCDVGFPGGLSLGFLGGLSRWAFSVGFLGGLFRGGFFSV